ncbi:SdpI family protein [[Clostridium] spiroforme]|nr:SdpI family protein [Thomasclavelia spiroformis]MBM6880555.1 SdpI family protein [Thomasclavelia spiroformis]MBM6929606.1 SdpI family protein [Thomasclavelia spiroformis]
MNVGIWLTDLLIPLVMIILGIYFYQWGPQKINPFFGYRTSMSMKNEDTWHFAHRYCGKIWIIWGWIVLIVTVIVLSLQLFVSWQAYFILCQLAVLVASIVPVELALRKQFDKNGQRRQNCMEDI